MSGFNVERKCGSADAGEPSSSSRAEQRRGGQDRKNRGISTPNCQLLKAFWIQRALAALKRRTRKEPAGGTCRQADDKLLHTKEKTYEAARSGIKTNVFSTDGRLSRSRGQIRILVF